MGRSVLRPYMRSEAARQGSGYVGICCGAGGETRDGVKWRVL
jgi:hypothetical protein